LQITLKRQENCLNFIQNNIKMRTSFALLVWMALIVACGSGGDKQAENPVDTTANETPDSSETFTPVDTSSEFIQTYSSNLQPWLDRTQRQTTVRLGDFEYIDNWVEDSLVESQANLTPDFYKKFKQVLVFSPDSSKVLDLGTYGAMESKTSTGQPTIVQGEPDSEIAVLDRATKKRRRIFFFGPSSSIEQGFWINNNTIVLAGRSEEQNTVKPTIWTVRVDSTSNFYMRYEPKKSQ
jgi:hypothetical protein